MAKKQGKGTINKKTEMPDGSWKIGWQLFIVLADGTIKRPSGTTYAPVGLTLAAAIQLAEEDMEAKRAEFAGESVLDIPCMTIGDLMPRYFAELEASVHAGELSARTVHINRELARLHIIPHLGKIKLRELRGSHFMGLQAKLKTPTAERPNPLGRTRQQVHQLLNRALDWAVNNDFIPYNPAKSVNIGKAPAPKRKRLEKQGQPFAWDEAQAEKLYITAVQDGTIMGWAIAFALYTGLRRGEIFGLRWSDIKLDKQPQAEWGTLSVRQAVRKGEKGEPYLGSPKTEASRRTLPLDHRAHRILRLVRRWQAQQKQRAANGRGAGFSNPEDLIFCTRKGELQRPDNIARKLVALTTKAGVPALNVHATRHTFASLAYLNKAEVPDISKALGHEKPSTTESIYLHHFDTLAPKLDLGGSAPKRAEAWWQRLDGQSGGEDAIFAELDQALNLHFRVEVKRGDKVMEINRLLTPTTKSDHYIQPLHSTDASKKTGQKSKSTQ